MRTRQALLVPLILGLSAPLRAQIAAGESAPDFSITDALNDGPKNLGELNGRAVLLDLFATW